MVSSTPDLTLSEVGVDSAGMDDIVVNARDGGIEWGVRAGREALDFVCVDFISPLFQDFLEVNLPL